MPKELKAILQKFLKESQKEQLQAAYDMAFDDFYSGEKLDRLMEVLKDDLYNIISVSYMAGYRAAGGTPPTYP